MSNSQPIICMSPEIGSDAESTSVHKLLSRSKRMVSSHKSYDPNQFLHYPENNPFSDAAQKRLNGLIEDVLRTGVVLVNGAGVDQVDQRQASTEEKQSVLPNGNSLQCIFSDIKTRQDEDDEDDDDDDEEYIPEFPKIDKGKGREVINMDMGEAPSVRSDSGDEAEVDRDYEEEDDYGEEILGDNLIETEDEAYGFDEEYMEDEQGEDDGSYEEEQYTENAHEKQHGFNDSEYADDEDGDRVYDEELEGNEYTYNLVAGSHVPEPRSPQSPECEVIQVSDDDDG